MKRFLAVILISLLCAGPASALEVLGNDALPIDAPSAILMEKSTGSVLFEKNAYEHLSPASVTKVMTLLLAAEAVDSGRLSLDDTVTTSAKAAGMGGSQVWLEEGEQMSVFEMLKCIAVASANDCCVALAEHLAGSEEGFISQMNSRAKELGLSNTHFTSCSGLTDSEAHYSCAYDLAVISRELIRHDMIKQFTMIWMDTIRNGEFGLSNTNKLIYYYPGATGLKTGFTSKAMYCLAATAERDGTEYIAVVLHAQTSAQRFDSAKVLFNHAFGSYMLMPVSPPEALPSVTVLFGADESIQPTLPDRASVLLEKRNVGSLRYDVSLPTQLEAPVFDGQEIGMLSVYAGDEFLCTLPILSDHAVARQNVWQRVLSLFRALV